MMGSQDQVQDLYDVHHARLIHKHGQTELHNAKKISINFWSNPSHDT